MENNKKRLLLDISYYTLVGLSILFSVVFILRVGFSEIPTGLSIIYYAWSVILIMVVIFDIYCSKKQRMKFFAGLGLFVLTVLCVLMAIIVFFVQGVSLETITALEITYFINMALSFIPIKLATFAFLFGEKIVNFHD